MKSIRDSPDYREKYRKNQRLDKLYDEFYAVKTLGEERTGKESLGPFKMSVRHELLAELISIQEKLRETVPEAELITPEEISAIKLAWIYDGDDQYEVDKIIGELQSVDEIDSLTNRLLAVEKDMSDVSRRIGIYGKLEKAIEEYSITKLSRGDDE